MKLKFIRDESKRENVLKEHVQLISILDNLDLPDITNHRTDLYNINQELWHIENYKRAMEQDQNFNADFVNAARQVYLKNDIRAKIKKEINLLVDSDIIEEKSY